MSKVNCATYDTSVNCSLLSVQIYRNLPKNGSPLKISLSPFENMPTHLCCSTCGYVKQKAPKKQHCARGETNKWSYTIYISKHMTKQAELLHAYINKARLTTCEVGVFWLEISQLLKIRPHPSITPLKNICPPRSSRSHLSSSPMGVFLKDYGTYVDRS